MVRFKLWRKKSINGIDINPEKDTAFPISIKSSRIKLEGFSKNWKKTKVKRDINITEIIFTIRSWKVKLYILKIFKNSTGMNNTKSDRQNNIKNQNSPCAFQVVTDLSTIPIDSRRR